MKELKPILFFLARFLITYIVLSLLYQLYLNQFIPYGLADSYTSISTDLSVYGLNSVGIDSKSIHYGNEEFMRIMVNNQYISIVNEGCNAISVIIIFISFLIGFYTNFKHTFIFGITGVIVIFIFNLFRIALLTYIFFAYPKYSRVAHDYLFPAMIYGAVLLLWVVWIKFFFNKYNQLNAKK